MCDRIKTILLIVCAMASLNTAILPRGAAGNRPMRHPEGIGLLLKRRSSSRMRRRAHRERHRIVHHDEKKGGRRSHARRKTPATVGEVASGWISEYFMRVRKWMAEIVYSNPVFPSMAGSC